MRWMLLSVVLLAGCQSLSTFQDPNATPMDHACNAAKMAVPFLVMAEQEVTKPADREAIQAGRAALQGFVGYCATRA